MLERPHRPGASQLGSGPPSPRPMDHATYVLTPLDSVREPRRRTDTREVAQAHWRTVSAASQVMSAGFLGWALILAKGPSHSPLLLAQDR